MSKLTEKGDILLYMLDWQLSADTFSIEFIQITVKSLSYI